MFIFFAEIEFVHVIGGVEVSSLEGNCCYHCREFFDKLAGWAFEIDLARILVSVVVTPGQVAEVSHALLNWASTVKMILVAPLLVPVL